MRTVQVCDRFTVAALPQHIDPQTWVCSWCAVSRISGNLQCLPVPAVHLSVPEVSVPHGLLAGTPFFVLTSWLVFVCLFVSS